MEELINAVLTLGAPALASEDAACDAVVAIRYPNGIVCRCGAATTRAGAKVTCSRARSPHHFTILDGTPFETKLEPSVRGLLLAMQAMATSTSVSARALARQLVDVSHVTLWRHLMTLRALFPATLRDPSAPFGLSFAAPSSPAERAATAQVTGRTTCALRAWVFDRGGDRIVVEPAVRGWLSSTFRGVSAVWLYRYLDELNARSCSVANDVAQVLVTRFLAGCRLPWHRVHPLRHIR